MREEKNNRKYAGQVVDIPRSNYRLSVIDRLKKMTDEEGTRSSISFPTGPFTSYPCSAMRRNSPWWQTFP